MGPNTAVNLALTAAVIAASSLGLSVWLRLHPLKMAQVEITIAIVMIRFIASTTLSRFSAAAAVVWLRQRITPWSSRAGGFLASSTRGWGRAAGQPPLPP